MKHKCTKCAYKKHYDNKCKTNALNVPTRYIMITLMLHKCTQCAYVHCEDKCNTVKIVIMLGLDGS